LLSSFRISRKEGKFILDKEQKVIAVEGREKRYTVDENREASRA